MHKMIAAILIAIGSNILQVILSICTLNRRIEAHIEERTLIH